MADFAVPALVRKRAELARGIEAAEVRLRELRANLAHVDATIRLFAPDYPIAQIVPKKAHPERPVLFEKGELGRTILDILRTAPEPMREPKSGVKSASAPDVAQIASTPFSATGFKLPEPKLPKFDLDAVFAVQKANLAASHEAQTVLVDAFQAIVRVQQDRVEQAVADAKAALARKQPGKPQAVLAEVKAAIETNVAVAKEVVDLAVAAQRRVAELFTQRTQASVEELKAAA